MVADTVNYERTLTRLKKEGKDKSDDEEYKAVLENYMRRSLSRYGPNILSTWITSLTF